MLCRWDIFTGYVPHQNHEMIERVSRRGIKVSWLTCNLWYITRGKDVLGSFVLMSVGICIGESRNRVHNSLQNQQYVRYWKWVECNFVSMDGDTNARWVVRVDVVSNLYVHGYRDEDVVWIIGSHGIWR